jgi:MFS transporter, DHA1 family, multidrug resistance protein
MEMRTPMAWSSELVTLMFATFVTNLGFGIIQPILPIFASDLKAAGFMLGLIFSGLSISKLIFNPLVGRLSDKWGRKIFIVTGLFAYTGVALSYTLVSTPHQLLFVRLAAGIAFSMVMPVVVAYMGSMSPKGEESFYMANLNLFVGIGMAIGPVLGGVLADLYNKDMAFIGQAILLFVAFLITLFLLPKDTIYRHTDQGVKRPFKVFFASNLMKGLALASTVSAMAISGLFVFMPLLCKSLKFSNTEVGILIAVVMILAGFLQLPFGKLAGRYNKVLFICVGGIIGAISMALLPECKNFWSFLAIGMMVAVGAAISAPAASGLIIEQCRGTGLGASVGMISSFQEAGLIAGPIVSGLIMDQFDLNSVFRLMAGLYAVTTILFYYFAKNRT